MRVNFNPTISYIRPRSQKRSYQTQVSFQAAKPQKIQSAEIFKMEAELKKVWFNDEKYKAVLKKYAHIDINSKNIDGDTIVTKAMREGDSFVTQLFWMENRGEIEGIDWNAKDANGDNLLMLAFKAPWRPLTEPFNELVKLANAGKIDVNYVNQRRGYSLLEGVLLDNSLSLHYLLKLKGLDLVKNTTPQKLLKTLIDKCVFPNTFQAIVCHPSIDIESCDISDLYKYIGEPSYDAYLKRQGLSDYEKCGYKNAIKTAIKINNAKKLAKYYAEEGELSLDQIVKHVDSVNDEQAINMPLNELGETIAHLLAEIPVEPKDEKRVKDLIEKMRNSVCYFWQEDSLSRSPLMVALENRNFVVARAMLEKMLDSELMYIDINLRGCLPGVAMKSSKINQVPALWNLIAELDLKDRQEFGALLIERINSSY